MLLESLPTFLQPLARLSGGAAAGGVVWKFFEKLDKVVGTEDKIKIWMWLGTPPFEGSIKQIERVPQTFARVFDALFGPKLFSWQFLWRSALVTYTISAAAFVFSWVLKPEPIEFAAIGYLHVLLLFTNVLPDYLSVLKTRIGLRWIGKTSSSILWVCFVALDVVISIYTANLGFIFGASLVEMTPVDTQLLAQVLRHPLQYAFAPTPYFFFIYPAFFATGWLCLYAASGFVLKAAKALDLGFRHFAKHFDIETKPLECIGFVAGVIVALGCWVIVLAARLRG
jgi:hypothetical protein